jgi:hypothetical protein
MRKHFTFGLYCYCSCERLKNQIRFTVLWIALRFLMRVVAGFIWGRPN